MAARAIEGQEGQTAARTFTARRTKHRTLRVDKMDGGYIELGAGDSRAHTVGVGGCTECAVRRTVPCQGRTDSERGATGMTTDEQLYEVAYAAFLTMAPDDGDQGDEQQEEEGECR